MKTMWPKTVRTGMAWSVAMAIAVIALECCQGAAGQVVTPIVSSTAPRDVEIPAGFTGDPVRFFDLFSWRTFVALNWPALADQRGEPDTAKALGDPAPNVVWGTWKADHEIFQPNGMPPSPWESFAAQSPDQFTEFANAGKVKVLGGFGPRGSKLQIEHFNQAGLAGNEVGTLVGSNRRYIRYEVRINKPEFNFIRNGEFYLAAKLPTTGQLVFPEGVRVLRAARPAQLIGGPDGGAMELAVADDCVRAAFVVDATGGRSGLVPRAFRRRLRFDRLIAVGFTLEVNASLCDTMRLASSSAGWWYTLPLDGQRTFVVFLTDGDLISVRRAALSASLPRQFQEAFASIPPNLSRAIATALVRDARTSCAARQWRGRWLRIGDAAFSMDPISGSGLAEGILLAEPAAASVSEFLRWGCVCGLQDFARGRIRTFAVSLERLRALYAGGRSKTVDSESPFWSRRGRADAFRVALERIG